MKKAAERLPFLFTLLIALLNILVFFTLLFTNLYFVTNVSVVNIETNLKLYESQAQPGIKKKMVEEVIRSPLAWKPMIV